MAVNRGVLGSQTGSMGGITASNWKGRNVYKQKVPASNLSNSPLQAAQRRKFALLAKLAGALGASIRIGYKMAAAKVTEQNAFYTANAASVTDNGTIASINYGQVQVSTGLVLGVKGMDVSYSATTGDVTVNFEQNSNGTTGRSTDRINIVVIDTVTGRTFFEVDAGSRTDGAISMTNPVGVGHTPANVRAYAFFKRIDGPDTSRTDTAAAHV